jgi:FkbM family methyltransferase
LFSGLAGTNALASSPAGGGTVTDESLAALLPEEPIALAVTRYGTMYGFQSDSVIFRSLNLYGEWAQHEIDVLSSLMTDGDTIVDVGANIGTHSLAFANRFPASAIVAIEPQPLPCAMLLTNALLNGYDNVRTFNVGCSAEVRVLKVLFDYDALETNAGALSLKRFSVGLEDAGYPILLVPLDQLGIAPRVQLIKIDVEGMESDVLRGASDTIARDRPIVFFEVLDLTASRSARDLLLNLGYSLYWLETHPFNVRNFRGYEENIWYRCELGILAIPSEMRTRPNLPPVTGDEVELPRFGDPRSGYGIASLGTVVPVGDGNGEE